MENPIASIDTAPLTLAFGGAAEPISRIVPCPPLWLLLELSDCAVGDDLGVLDDFEDEDDCDAIGAGAGFAPVVGDGEAVGVAVSDDCVDGIV